MEIKPDDYLNNGLIEIARFGRHTLMKNIMSDKQNQYMLYKLKKKYPVVQRKIQRLIVSIKKQVSKCDPIQLLSFSSDVFLISNLGISSECQLSRENIVSSKMTEYIQSILVSTPLQYKQTKKDPSKRFFHIKKDMAKLYKMIDSFYLCWMANIQEHYPNYDDEIRKIIFESQLLYTVRGHRYQVFEIEYYEKLLMAHNDAFINIFGVSSGEIINGIKKMQYALSQGKIDSIKTLGKLADEFFESEETDIEKFRAKHLKENMNFVEDFFGTRLRNVIDITNWPEKFVKCLSWELNECTDFYDENEFAGWPIIDLPIQKRPFIVIDNKYYCFDYYSFMDNFYRAVQKAISREAPDYKWSDFQKEASENMVADVFSQILPGCKFHRDNYYPQNKSIKKLTENDLIIEYENVLLIVEVKAGSFVYTPPITDFENHIKSYKSLIEKADHQCMNTYNFLTSTKIATFYNKDASKKFQIDMSKISDIYMVTVTIDNINDFAARAEKLNFLQLKCDAISLSIDDLMVYREFFDSPLVFLHFLKQRRQATQESKLALSDELDHLGMYIKHNMYCLQLKEYPDDAIVQFYGYREELDKYFCSLYHPQLKSQKPSQTIPDLFVSIIKYLTNSNNKMKVDIADYLLNFSSEAKDELVKSVDYALNRQNKTGNMIAFSTAGDSDSKLRYTLFVEQPGVLNCTEKYKREYTLSTLIWNGEKNRTLLNFKFDNSNIFIGLSFKRYTVSDIKNDEYSKLLIQGKNRAEMRVDLYLKQYKTIENNQFCPCASGKIYSECCGFRRARGQNSVL